MKRTLATAALALALSSGVMLAASSAQAQSAERVYDNGTVWTISQIETKPGMFDDYMKYLSTTWRQIQEAGKKAGYVLSYKVLTVDSPRDHEPDVILMVEFKNMAAFDRTLAEQDAVTSAAFGSTVKANQSSVSRESLRVLRGSETARELIFTK
ncbi:MAG TPA: hypothetical protein VF459_11630 [Caulobacteraceae bacterium]